VPYYQVTFNYLRKKHACLRPGYRNEYITPGLLFRTIAQIRGIIFTIENKLPAQSDLLHNAITSSRSEILEETKV